MRTSRLMISALVVGLASVSLGVAKAWLSDSVEVHHTISAASSFGETPDKVWVCKVVGSGDDLRLAAGTNPLHVSVHSIDAQEGFSDDHPSYLVANGESVCHLPDADGSGFIIDEESIPSDTSTTEVVTDSNSPGTEESQQEQPGALSESGGGPNGSSTPEESALGSPTGP